LVLLIIILLLFTHNFSGNADGSITAKVPSAAVNIALLQKIHGWIESGATEDDVIDRLRIRCGLGTRLRSFRLIQMVAIKCKIQLVLTSAIDCGIVMQLYGQGHAWLMRNTFVSLKHHNQYWNSTL